MSSFYSSAYRKARKVHTCCDCHKPIITGYLYLSYAQGLRNSVPVCLTCSVKIEPQGVRLRWDCKAARDRVKELGDQAGYQPQPQLGLLGEETE